MSITEDCEIFEDFVKKNEKRLINSVDWYCGVMKAVFDENKKTHDEKVAKNRMGIKFDKDLLIRHEKRMEKIRKCKKKHTISK